MTPAAARARTPAPGRGPATHEPHHPAPGRRAGTGTVVGTGVAAGVLSGIAMGLWLVFSSEIASEPTPVPGIDSSTWTPLTGITAFLFGVDAFHGDFHVLSILFGLAAHLVLSAVFGILGVALIAYTFAGRPGVVGAAIFGFGYGLLLQVLNVNIIVNNLQDTKTVYDALPSWSWWVAHALYGSTLGILAARALSLSAPGVTPEGLPARSAA